MIGRLLAPCGVELKGMTSSENNQIEDGFIGKSRETYKRIYPRLAQAIEVGKEVTIRISNFGRSMKK